MFTLAELDNVIPLVRATVPSTPMSRLCIHGIPTTHVRRDVRRPDCAMGARPPAHYYCLSLLMDPLLAQLELALAIGRMR